MQIFLENFLKLDFWSTDLCSPTALLVFVLCMYILPFTLYLLFSSLNVNLGLTNKCNGHTDSTTIQVCYPHCQFSTIPRVVGSLFILFPPFEKRMSFLRGRDRADEQHRRQIRKMFDKADKENIDS